jgi:hypothetical protein
MNNKIQQLINDGVITVNDVMEYATEINDKAIVDSYEDLYDKYDFEYDDHDDTMSAYPQDDRDEYPEYIIASTSYRLKETYVFEANEKGEIHDYAEYGGIAERFGDSTWMNYYGAIDRTFGENKYQFVRRIETGVKDVIHMLFKRIDNNIQDDCPQLPQDTWDGGQTDEK